MTAEFALNAQELTHIQKGAQYAEANQKLR